MIRPRALVHRGSVIAAGFALDRALLGEHETRRRVLALWRPGATVRAHGGWLLITGLAPARVHTARAPGAPLVAQRDLLAAMPLAPDELDAIAPHAAAGVIVLATAGACELVDPVAIAAIDATAWLALDDYAVVEVAPLAAAARAELPRPARHDAREVLGVPPGDRRAGAVGVQLATLARGSARPARTSWPRRLASWLAARLAPDVTAAAEPDARGVAAAAVPPWWRRVLAGLAGRPAPVRSRALVRRPRPALLDRLRAWAAEALWRSQLGALLGRRHAEYLHRLLSLFDRGELDDALRLAIPIGGDGGGARRLALAPPAPRDKIELAMSRSTASSTIPVADRAIAAMRERYRAAAARLEQQGRINDAAFVLADLLGDVLAAIALLERHERFAVAAELAEGRDLAPPVAIRLWLLAGNVQRAIDLARRHHAWAAVLERLTHDRDRRADPLRLLWAEHLASAGDYVQAVAVAWPLAPARALIGVWIDRAIAVGGPAAARLLVKKLALDPASLPVVGPQVLAVLDGDRDGGPERDPELDRTRRALLDELVAAPPGPALRTIARPAVRAWLRTAVATGEPGATDLLDRLVRFADDATLRADRPALPRGSAPRDPRPLVLRWTAHDRGALAVWDAAALPGGRMLIALGELGVRILDRNGKIAARIDQPAEHLVLSDHGTRALALARRGQVVRIAKIDLALRRGWHWCDAECDGGAASFDGDLWLATQGREVLAIDTTAAHWRAVWGVQTEPADARCVVRRAAGAFVIEATSAAGCEHWFYEGFTLRRRDPRVPRAEWTAARLLQRDWIAISRGALCGTDWRVQLDDLPVTAFDTAGELVVIAQPSAAGPGSVVTAVDTRAQQVVATLQLEAALQPMLRLTGTTLLVIPDEHGPIVLIDLAARCLVRELRVD